jgi:ABC-type antimicrobial peptide transport system permease subunit
MSFPASFANNLRAGVSPTYYPAVGQPVGQYPLTMAYQLVTDGDPAVAIPAARSAIQSFNQGVMVTMASTLDDQVSRLVREERVVAQLASVVGSVALLLACIGLYGLLSHIVARRTNEIGIRMALGAQRAAIAAMVLRDLAMLVLIGVAIGVPASVASARFVRNQVFGLGPADPQTLVAVLAIMFAVAAIAGYVPARRAARIDPLTAIRID